MNCNNCQQSFTIQTDDQEFYKKMIVPVPKLCADCRQQRRMAFRNEKTLYLRKCGLCQRNILSIFSPDKNFTVYCEDCYWSDKWSAQKYAQEFDFNQPFFEQLKELRKKVPQIALYKLSPTSENSDFANDIAHCKNSYLVFDGEGAQNCLYGETFYKINECLDFYRLIKSELCYECINCENGYALRFCRFCENCNNSWFLKDCKGCQNCFGCANLINQEYCIGNKQHTKEDYDEFINNLNLGNHIELDKIKKKAEENFLRHPVKSVRGYKNEKSSGDNLYYCANSQYCFDSNELNNCRYCFQVMQGAKDSLDIDIWGQNVENCYDCAGVGWEVRNIIASYYIFDKCHDIQHSIFCHRGCHDLFGCVGMQKAEYCILNKKYSEQEYKKLLPRVIAKCRQEGIYGQFFPVEFSMFSYNETIAYDYYPLTKKQVLANGWSWKEQVIKSIDLSLPYCKSCNNNFKIIPQEKEFYRKLKLPEPLKCYNCRHLDRLKLRNPRKLWDRQCVKCKKDIKTTYHPNRLEIIYCEQCYLSAVM